MGKEEDQVSYGEMVQEVRKGCVQFARMYFHFVKTLYDHYGHDEAKERVRQAIFELGLDRSGRLRKKAEQEGLATNDSSDFQAISDLPRCGWVPELGRNHCPYGECWRAYFEEYPWFKEFALYYCDVIDTTNIENFSRHLSHRITQNVMEKGERCERVYFESQAVRNGTFTYGGESSN
ncbi:MAG: L-2-amino-thiazoline-4-carboxylic acid hydrolase [Clostridiales bacterium]|nr:L-2-amino-thiazoline-4-carboxylic acid hydrolase [Clostridiales bacterium]